MTDSMEPMAAQEQSISLRRLLILAAIVLFAFLAGQFYIVMGDDGTYIALARSLRAGMYRAINVPGAPVQSQYPPLFPLLLYPVAGYTESSVGVMRLWVACWSLLAVFPIAAMAKLRDPATGYLAALPFVVSAQFGEYSTIVMTESVFVAVTYAVLARAVHADGFDPKVAAGIILAWLMRSSGVALLAAVTLAFLFRKKYSAAFLTLLLVAVGMAPWWYWQFMNQSDYIRGHILAANIYDPSAGTYSISDLFTKRIPHNLTRYAGRVLADVIFVPWFRSIAPYAPYFLWKVAASLFAGAMIVVGIFRKLRSRSWSVEDLYVLVSAGIFLVHPVFSDRYLYAILPSLIGYFVWAGHSVNLRARIAIALGIVSVAGCILALAEPVSKENAAFIEAVEWIDEHAAPDDVILARKPTAVWFYTGRVATSYPTRGDEPIWNDPKVKYVIRDDYTIGLHSARKYLDPILKDSVVVSKDVAHQGGGRSVAPLYGTPERGAGATFSHVYTSAILPEVKIYEVHHGGKSGEAARRR